MENITEQPKKPFNLDISQITKKDEQRLYAFAYDIVDKNESKFNDSVPNFTVVNSGTIEPESPDVGELYRFPELVWYIYRDNKCWSFILLSKKKLLYKVAFLKI